MRTCEYCYQRQPLTAFGKNSARADGIHIYCRECCRSQVKAYRERCNDQKKAAKYRHGPMSQARQMMLLDSVVAAIHGGARTQPQIAWKARVRGDDLGEVLATLILIKGQVATRVNQADEREYFIRRAA